MQSVIERSKYGVVEAPPSASGNSLTSTASLTGAIEAGFAARESWAYEAAYVAYRSVLIGAAYDVLRDRAEAEDCVHDVLLRLWHRGNAYTTDRGRLRAFLAICVRNEALMQLRRRGHFSQSQNPQGKIDDMAGVADNISLLQTMKSLTAEQRDVINLAYYQGMTHEQIASALGAPLGTIKSRLSAALRRLRASLVKERP